MICFNLFTHNPIELLGKSKDVLPKNYIPIVYSDKNAQGVKTFKSQTSFNFLDEECKGFLFKTNKANKIIEVKFSIYQILEAPNYMDRFVESFGEPLSSYCVDNITKASETTLIEQNAAVGSIEATIKICNYEENMPVFSIWKIKEHCFLEIVHPDYRNTYPRIRVRLTKNNELLR